jgi:two-component system sensor histidine kinase DegS
MRDDGCGFDPAAVSGSHHGLALMAQRVELARGTFMVTSAPGRGTRVRMEVPI